MESALLDGYDVNASSSGRVCVCACELVSVCVCVGSKADNFHIVVSL